jgi:hypothetical protein
MVRHQRGQHYPRQIHRTSIRNRVTVKNLLPWLHWIRRGSHAQLQDSAGIARRNGSLGSKKNCAGQEYKAAACQKKPFHTDLQIVRFLFFQEKEGWRWVSGVNPLFIRIVVSRPGVKRFTVYSRFVMA